MSTGILDYELMDFGDGRKLERFGKVITDRPEVLVSGVSKAHPSLWNDPSVAVYQGEANAPGRWTLPPALPAEWPCRYQNRSIAWQALCSFGSHKHVGIFPEQLTHWNYLSEKCAPGMLVLNLFGYTGAASLTAAAAGAKVYHVDASRSIINRAAQNARESGIDSIHWVCEDALLFAEREMKRGRKYHMVILDPPIYGRGRKGELWKLEEKLPALMHVVRHLLEPGSTAILNTYSPAIGVPAMKASARESGLRNTESGWLSVIDIAGRNLGLSKYLLATL